MDTTKLPDWIKSVLAYRRKLRVKFMLSKVWTNNSMRIIDIGCGVDGRSFDDYLPANWEITGVDILPPYRIKHKNPNFTYVQQSAADLNQYGDKEFDLAVSIGMLEHITEKHTFNSIISEIQRVARQYIVIVPYRYAWLEPHYGVPFFPIFPYSTKLFIIKLFNLSGQREVLKQDPTYVKRQYQWLSNKEYRTLFPEAKIFLIPTLETIAIIKSCN